MFSIDDWLITHFFMWKKFDAKAKLKVTKKIIKKEGSNKAILFFPYWSGKSEIYHKISKELKDYTLIYYDYPKEAFSRKVNVSLKYLREVLLDAFNLILDLRKKGYKEISLVGSSLGSNIALKLASMIKVEKVVLNMIDRSLALEIMTSSALGILRKRLKNQGIRFEKLEKIYKFISTEEILPLIKRTNVKILLLLSKNDIFCSLKQFKPVLEEIKDLNIDCKIKINYFLGHILSIYKNLYFNRKIIKFLNKE